MQYKVYVTDALRALGGLSFENVPRFYDAYYAPQSTEEAPKPEDVIDGIKKRLKKVRDA